MRESCEWLVSGWGSSSDVMMIVNRHYEKVQPVFNCNPQICCHEYFSTPWLNSWPIFMMNILSATPNDPSCWFDGTLPWARSWLLGDFSTESSASQSFIHVINVNAALTQSITLDWHEPAVLIHGEKHQPESFLWGIRQVILWFSGVTIF